MTRVEEGWRSAELIVEVVRHFLLRIGVDPRALDSLSAVDGDIDGMVAGLTARGLLGSAEARLITGVWRGYIRAPLAELLPVYAPDAPARGGASNVQEDSYDSAADELPAPPAFGTLTAPGSEGAHPAAALGLDDAPVADEPAAVPFIAVDHAPSIGARLGPYTLASEVGRDRWSVTYRATCDGVTTALIRMLKESAPVELARSIRARTAALVRLRHPAILSPIAGGVADQRPFLVYPFVPAIDLRDLLQIVGRLELAALLRLATALVEALAWAYDAQLTHGDIKPASVLWAEEGASVLLTGFGFSHAPRSRYDEDASSSTSALYSAPEQLGEAASIDPRVDMYGLGATLFHAAVGRAAFTEAPLADPVRARLHGEAASVEALAPELPPGLTRLIARMLRRRPEERFSSWQEVREALQRITARPHVAALQEGRS